MWKLLLNTQRVIQDIRPFRIKYSTARGGFYENLTLARKMCSLVIDSNVALIWVASFLGLKSSLTESDPTLTIQQQILSMVLQVLFVGLFSLFLAAIWTFQFRGPSTVWVMTQAKDFNDRRGGDNPSGKKGHVDLFDVLLLGTIVVCIVCAITLGLAPILSSHTPAHMILQWIVTLFCCVYLGAIGTLGVLPVFQVLAYMCAVLCESKFILLPAYKSSSKKKGHDIFQKSKSIYMQSRRFQDEYNAFGHAIFPMAITCGFLINVVCSLICIEFYSHLHPMLLACFAGFDLITAGICVGLNTFAMVSSEEADRFQKYWKVRLFAKNQRKDLQACMPIRCEIGPFFVLKRSTLLHTMLEVINATVSLLIMDE